MTLCLAALTLGLAAQEKTADEWKNEGNEAVRNKQHQQALECYQKAITMWGDSVDIPTVFNAGICAFNLKQFDVAQKYFTQSKTANYKVEECAYRIAMILNKQKKDEEYHAALEEGYATYKNGKFAAMFKKDLAKWYRTLALADYNAGAEITKKCATVKDAKQMDKLKAEAKEKYEAAMPNIDKALEINPDDANSKQVKEGLEKQLAALQQ